MTDVRIFLDVDGVLNACGDPREHPEEHWGDFDVAQCNGYRITYSPKMGAALRALDAEIIWLTTWRGLANEHIRPLFGWEPFEVLEPGIGDHTDHGWWKSNILQPYIAANPGPFIWLDDDYNYSKGQGEVKWLEELDTPYFPISPRFDLGLAPEHIELMRGFIAACKSRDPVTVDV